MMPRLWQQFIFWCHSIQDREPLKQVGTYIAPSLSVLYSLSVPLTILTMTWMGRGQRVVLVGLAED